MAGLTTKLHEYYKTEKLFLGEDDDPDYYRVELKPVAKLLEDVERMATKYRRGLAKREGNDLSKLGPLTPDEMRSGLQRILYWSMLQSQNGGLFDDFPRDAEITVCQLSERYATTMDDIRAVMPYVGKTSAGNIKVFFGSKARPSFIADINNKKMILYFKNRLSLDEITALAKPFVGGEEVALWIADFIKKMQQARN